MFSLKFWKSSFALRFADQKRDGEITEEIGERDAGPCIGTDGQAFAGEKIVITGHGIGRDFEGGAPPNRVFAHRVMAFAHQLGTEPRDRNNDRASFMLSRQGDDVFGFLSHCVQRDVAAPLKHAGLLLAKSEGLPGRVELGGTVARRVNRNPEPGPATRRLRRYVAGAFPATLSGDRSRWGADCRDRPS